MQKNKKIPVIANEKIDDKKLANATKIILGLQQELKRYIAKGHGPFLAAIYDSKGNLIAKTANRLLTNLAVIIMQK